MIFHQLFQKSDFNMIFELTEPGIPKQNGKVEKAFTTISVMNRFILTSASILFAMRKGYCSICISLSV
jgi:hypothetical protein